MSRRLYWTTVIIGTLFLTMYWIKALVYLENNNFWGHKNYWGADVGTFLILAALIVLTPSFIYGCWKYYPKENKMDK